MRSFLLLLALVCASSAAAQTAGRHWIFFDGKPGLAPGGYVSERAMDRRAARGEGDPRAYDAPVDASYLDQLRAHGVTVRVASRWLNAVSAPLSADQVEAIRALPFVREIRPVAQFAPLEVAQAALQPLVPRAELPDYGASSTQLSTINAIAALERGFNGTGVVLGFLDTEFGGFTHPAFARMVNEGRLLGTQNFTPGAQSNRHGQSVASIAVGYAEGELIGPGWGASVLAATTEYAPSETNAEEDALVAGLEWMESQGVDVVNISLGYTTFDTGQHSYTAADLDGDTGITTRAADIAASLGVVVVASAGNEGCGNPASCWYYVGTPADGDSVIAVGAVNRDSSKASFSSFGPTADGRIKPDVSAQGTSVRHAVGSTYASGSGTSFSSPLVAGVVTQMLQANPSLTPMQVRAILRQTASQAQNPDNRLGWGIIDADRAVQEALALNVTPTRPGALSVRVAPTPSRGEQTFFLTGQTDETATLQVFDATGRLMAVPFTGTLVGDTRVAFHTDLPAGLYLYRLTAGAAQVTGTFVRLR